MPTGTGSGLLPPQWIVVGGVKEKTGTLGGSMSGEMIAVLSVGIGLGLLSTGLFAWLRTDMVRIEERLRADMTVLGKRQGADLTTVEGRLRADIKQLDDRVGRLEYGQAKLEGLLEGLREAIAGRAAS